MPKPKTNPANPASLKAATPPLPFKTVPWEALTDGQREALRSLDLENIALCRFETGSGGMVTEAHWPTKIHDLGDQALEWGPAEQIMRDGEHAIYVYSSGTMMDVEVWDDERGPERKSAAAVNPPGDGIVTIVAAAEDPALAVSIEVSHDVPVAATSAATVLEAARGVVRPSPLNPRKHFKAEEQEKLLASVKARGIVQPLIVRPAGEGFEIMEGERRWRVAEMLGLATVPVLVREMDDVAALELMLTTSIQRHQLSALEECDAFAFALAQKDASGAAVYATQKAFADKIGVSEDVVKARLMLGKLSAAGRAALEEEKVSYRIMRRVCFAPAALVPRIEDVVLHPRKWPLLSRLAASVDDALTLGEVEELIDSLSMDLSRAPFDLADAALVPLKTSVAGERCEGGACVGCEFSTAAPGSKDSRPKCLLPSCYKKKVDVFVAAELVKATASGAKVVKDSEAKSILHGGAHGGLSPDYVELTAKVEGNDLAPGVTEKAAPTWRDVVTSPAGGIGAQVTDGAQKVTVEAVPAGAVLVPVLVAVDDHGRVRQFAERSMAVAAAEKTGQAVHLSLASGRGNSLQTDEAKAQQKQREADARAAEKRRREVSFTLMELLVAAVEEQGVSMEVWTKLLELAVRHAGSAGCAFVEKRRSIERGSEWKIEEARAKGFGVSARAALVLELLLAQDFAAALQGSADAPVAPDYVGPVLKAYGVSEKMAEKAVLATEKMEAAKAKEPKAAKKKTGEQGALL